MTLERRSMELATLINEAIDNKDFDFISYLDKIRPEVNDRIRRTLGNMFQGDGPDEMVMEMALRGKRLRAGITMIVFDLLSDDMDKRDQAIDLAAAIEIAHCASLIIDDIIDEDQSRRGFASLHVIRGHRKAMLESVGLLSYPYAITAPYGGEYVRELSEAHRLMVGGAISEIDFGPGDNASVRYGSIMTEKTGRLFGLAARFGARAAGCKGTMIDSLTSFGLWSGIAMQLADDMADATCASSGNASNERNVQIAVNDVGYRPRSPQSRYESKRRSDRDPWSIFARESGNQATWMDEAVWNAVDSIRELDLAGRPSGREFDGAGHWKSVLEKVPRTIVEVMLEERRERSERNTS